MFKKLFLIVALLSGWGANSLWAWQQIPMQIINEGSSHSGPTYAPPRPLYITQDDYVLTFTAFEDDYTLELRDENDVIVDGSFTGSGCAISQASVDMMLDDIIGKKKDEALGLANLFMGMIKGEVTDDSALEELDEAASLKNISFMPARVKCAVLGWHTMEEMLKNNRTTGSGSTDHCSTE